jgi:lysophospholipase
MHHTESTFTSFDGLSIYRQGWLPEGTPRGVVLLLHGLGEHSGRYEHVAAALVEAGYAVQALDHRGHGKSEGRRVYVKSYEEFQRDLLQFRRLVEAEHPGLPLVVMGHSMGGNLAVGHVLDHQDGVKALVLSGPALKLGDSLPKWQVKILLLIAKVAPKLRPQALDASTISRDPAVVAAYVADPLVHSGKVTAGLGAALIRAMRSFPARYPSLRLPVLLLHGTHDQLADIGGTKELERLAVNAQITSHYYEGLYHEVFNEPEQATVLADLTGWLHTVV